MSINIRPFAKTDDDYALMAELHNEVWEDHPETVETLQHQHSVRSKELIYRDFILEWEGRPVGVGFYGEPQHTYVKGKYWVSALVIPEARGRGVGTAFYNHVLAEIAQCEPRPTILAAGTREDKTDSVRFLEKRGFKLVMRFPISILDVPKFDPEPYQALLRRVAESGIAIKSLTELMTEDEAWREKFYHLTEHQIMPDVPLPAPYQPESLEQFTEAYLKHPAYNSDGIFVALDGDQYVASTALFQPKWQPGKFYTGLTGVLRSHRRRGIAKAIKAVAITYAQSQGAQIIETDNEENNPMYDLNMQLGFQPQPADLDYEKPWDTSN